MAFSEDFASYFVDYGVDAVIGGATVRGIFDNDFLTTLGVTAGSGPVLLLPTVNVGSSALGDAITVGGASYTLVGIEPDGTGLTLLRLQEA